MYTMWVVPTYNKKEKEIENQVIVQKVNFIFWYSLFLHYCSTSTLSFGNVEIFHLKITIIEDS